MDMRAKFGATIRELRRSRGMSQEDLAAATDIDRTYVSGIERGMRNPSLDIIYRLAFALDVHVRNLFPND